MVTLSLANSYFHLAPLTKKLSKTYDGVSRVWNEKCSRQAPNQNLKIGETIFILRNKAAFFSLKTHNVEQIPLFRVQMATGLVSFFPKVVSLPFLVREKSK